MTRKELISELQQLVIEANESGNTDAATVLEALVGSMMADLDYELANGTRDVVRTCVCGSNW